MGVVVVGVDGGVLGQEWSSAKADEENSDFDDDDDCDNEAEADAAHS